MRACRPFLLVLGLLVTACGSSGASDDAAPPADALRTGTGLAYRWLVRGDATVAPRLGDKVNADITGWTRDGKMFESSLVDGEPFTLEVGGGPKGLSEALMLMHHGDRLLVWVPAALGYGETTRRAGNPGGDLTFELELLSIE